MDGLNVDHLPERERYILDLAYTSIVGLSGNDKAFAEKMIADIVKFADTLYPIGSPPTQPAGDAVRDVVSNLRQSAKLGDYDPEQIAYLESIADRLEAALAAPVQPSADRDPYEGAREDLLDWKGRAQRAEAELRQLGYTGITASEAPVQPVVDGTHTAAPCMWVQDAVDDSWDTGCGNKHQFTDGDAADNLHAFCPYCGGRLFEPNHDAQPGEGVG